MNLVDLWFPYTLDTSSNPMFCFVRIHRLPPGHRLSSFSDKTLVAYRTKSGNMREYVILGKANAVELDPGRYDYLGNRIHHRPDNWHLYVGLKDQMKFDKRMDKLNESG